MELGDYPLWTALITPMLRDGRVDGVSLKALVKEQDSAGNGILLLGSTGESLALGEKERRDILALVLAEKPSVPLMVGVGGINLGQTKAWVEYLNTLEGLHAYLMVTPLYAKPGPRGQEAWFQSLLDVATRPVMLYNIPSRTGIPLSHGALKNLTSHPRLWAIKEASGSTEEFARYQQDAPSACFYSGDDALMPDFSSLGAKGLVSVASNVWPRETHRYVRENLEKRFQDHALWLKASQSLFCASNPIPVKALLAHLGRIETPVLRLPLSDTDLGDTGPLLAQHKAVKNWGAHGPR